MWTRDELDLIDKDVGEVVSDFIIAEGTSVSISSVLEGDKTPFGRSFFVPVFYSWKVHEGHPINITSRNHGHVFVYPVADKNSKRMPREVYRDSNAYDCSMFALAPFDVDVTDTGFGKYILKEGFLDNNGDSSNASLLYLDRGCFIHSQDGLKVASIMPSQLSVHFGDWLMRDEKIYSHDKTFDQRLEGRMNILPENTRDVFNRVIEGLEKRYDSKLFFDR